MSEGHIRYYTILRVICHILAINKCFVNVLFFNYWQCFVNGLFYLFFNLTCLCSQMKWLHGLDGMGSRAEFGQRAIVWRP